VLPFPEAPRLSPKQRHLPRSAVIFREGGSPSRKNFSFTAHAEISGWNFAVRGEALPDDRETARIGANGEKAR